LIKIDVTKFQSFEQAMKVLKSKMKKEHVIEDHKKHLRYEKPSDRRRKERIEAIKRTRKTQAKNR